MSPFLRIVFQVLLFIGLPALVGACSVWMLLGRRRWTRARCGACRKPLNRAMISERGACDHCGRSLDEAGVPTPVRAFAFVATAIVLAGLAVGGWRLRERWLGPVATRPAEGLNDVDLAQRARFLERSAVDEFERRVRERRLDIRAIAEWIVEDAESNVRAGFAPGAGERQLACRFFADAAVQGDPALRERLARTILASARADVQRADSEDVQIVIQSPTLFADGRLRCDVLLCGATFNGEPVAIEGPATWQGTLAERPQLLPFGSSIRMPSLAGRTGTLVMEVEVWLDREINADRRRDMDYKELPRDWWPDPVHRHRETISLTLPPKPDSGSTQPNPARRRGSPATVR